MLKAKLYKGGPLEGEWLITLKIDGVRMLRDEEGHPVSRAGKPLYNLGLVPRHVKDAEIFANTWEDTITLVRTKSHKDLDPAYVFSLEPLDPRLLLGQFNDPTEEEIKEKLDQIVAWGHEGLILRQGSKWLKVKPAETFDVEVTGTTEGKGKYANLIGALVTPMGKVSGMTDEERIMFTLDPPVGKTIEVECMGLTPKGKFRHPRFKRVRWDK